jgi:hypothetical protein
MYEGTSKVCVYGSVHIYENLCIVFFHEDIEFELRERECMKARRRYVCMVRCAYMKIYVLFFVMEILRSSESARSYMHVHIHICMYIYIRVAVSRYVYFGRPCKNKNERRTILVYRLKVYDTDPQTYRLINV